MQLVQFLIDIGEQYISLKNLNRQQATVKDHQDPDELSFISSGWQLPSNRAQDVALCIITLRVRVHVTDWHPIHTEARFACCASQARLHEPALDKGLWKSDSADNHDIVFCDGGVGFPPENIRRRQKHVASADLITSESHLETLSLAGEKGESMLSVLTAYSCTAATGCQGATKACVQ